ncbi:SDR family oxidoreductase [Rossellomorea aquimaris]|uniref:NAD(P)-dependent oxidoreductase n=1 Tax=Rossellomorea aquimaris TaxID=189382 RepID=UPI001CD6FFED|nr:NAD(P)-binding oxidoreductase [Rossellomorea aquimaris]MCA1061027.1 SDR family oxidoreductase [Rossellomorea aquimaris]
MKLIVFGATGGTGKEVVKQALADGHEVTAFIRNPIKMSDEHPLLTIVQGDALSMKDVGNALTGHEAVISCLGSNGLKETNILTEMTKNILNGMKTHNIERIAYVASAGINKEIPGLTGKLSQFILRNVLKDHGDAVEEIKKQGVHYTIARPMQLTTQPLSKTYRQDTHSIPVKGRKIGRADVAHFLLQSVVQGKHMNESIGLAY